MKDQILQLVSEWIDAAAQPNSTEHRLTFERASVQLDPVSKTPISFTFTVRAESNVSAFKVPIIKPSGLVLPQNH